MEYFTRFYQNPVGSTWAVKLYEALLKRFQIEMGSMMYEQFYEYQSLVFDVVEDLHVQSVDDIKEVLEYLCKEDPYLLDVIIMSWCLPRPVSCFSKRRYQQLYEERIDLHMDKLVELVEIDPIKNFCVETLTKTNNVPVHCIDLLWRYMASIEYQLTWCNEQSGNYISVRIEDEEIVIGLNVYVIDNLGLGDRKNQKEITFGETMIGIITNPDVVRVLLSQKTGDNLRDQLRSLDKIYELSKEIKDLLG